MERLGFIGMDLEFMDSSLFVVACRKRKGGQGYQDVGFIVDRRLLNVAEFVCLVRL